MQWSILLLGLAATSTALIRFQCSQLVTQRLDPLVSPGMIPSPHVHQIVGGVSTAQNQPEASTKYVTELFQCDYGSQERHAGRVKLYDMPIQ